MLNEIYDDEYKGYCLKTKLAQNTWQIKLFGESIKFDGESLVLNISNEIKNVDLPNLKKLYLTKKKVEAADVENSKKLEELHLFSDDVLSFELKNLKRLFVHKINNLVLRDGAFDKCIELEEIYFYDLDSVPTMNALSLEKLKLIVFERCIYNKISFENLNMFQSLKSLSLVDCKIEKMEKLSLENLETLNLSDNRLTSFDDKIILECKNLKELILSENVITDVSFDNIAFRDHLKFIDLSKNLLKNVPLIPNLRKLDISFNELICFSLPNTDSIEEIIFDNNTILAKPEVINTKSLKNISFKIDKLCVDINDLLPNQADSLAKYHLSNLDILRAVFKRNCSAACTNGKIFQLKKDKEYPKQIYYNYASNLRKRNELIVEHGVKEINNTVRKSKYEILTDLELDNNDDYHCSSCGTTIELLNLETVSINRERCFDRFKETLEELHLENVKLEINEFPNLASLKNLKNLSISNCLTIDSNLIIDETNVPKKIKHFSLVKNRIKFIQKLSLNENDDVNLSENGIENIETIECKYTQQLNLSKNQLKSLINLKKLKYIKVLNLDYNEISEVDDFIFDELSKLKTVSLNYNQLTRVCLTKSKSIEHIFTNGNKIKEI